MTKLTALAPKIQGSVQQDELYRALYATDASVYRKIPEGVVFPKTLEDLKSIVNFAGDHELGLIPRTAGTSLAGQCVGDGLVIDFSKHFTKVLEINTDEQWVRVQPGVIRDDLNRILKPYGYFFGPNTSTSNRCMIGGMVGNNSSGTTSIQYGVTRDKVIELKTILSDGSTCVFNAKTKEEINRILEKDDLESRIYKEVISELTNAETQREILENFPSPSIHRRCTGYAVDSLLTFEEFGGKSSELNLAKLLSGSEGTLALTYEVKIKIDKLPPTYNAMVAAQFDSVDESLIATVEAMKHDLYTCELMDKVILDCTKNNREQQKNRFFIEGDPGAILMLEVAADTQEKAMQKAENLARSLKSKNLGYTHPILTGNDIDKCLELRKAGLGLLGNIVGDKKAVACIEDTAVELEDLPSFIMEFSQIMKKHGQQAVYYAHAGAGEIHLRPILNLKKQQDVELFRTITTETAKLTKRYNGSFSGEHGDGIVRAEFIPLMIGEKNYQLLERIKDIFDPQNIFNPGKIVRAFKMDENLRYEIEREEPDIKTFLDFEDSEGILRLSEKCNGSGDCRKSPEAGGTLCPSYRATRDEKNTTRGRANALREFLTNSSKANRFDHQELKEVFDLCLSCKACSSECPSNVDVASLKMEFLHQFYKANGIPLRSKLFAYSGQLNRLGALVPGVTNFIMSSALIKNAMGVASQRSIPKLDSIKNRKSLKSTLKKSNLIQGKKDLYLFVDEFTDLYESQLGKDAIELLNGLGFKVGFIKHPESARSFLSKGVLKPAKKIIDKQVNIFKDVIDSDCPLVGLEPSAILGFRDEYPRLASDKKSAEKLKKNCLTIEEFLSKHIDSGRINSSQFKVDSVQIKIHGHCHQKALSNIMHTQKILNLPENYTSNIMNTGCCGMAGSFGYEKEHYGVSMQVGEDTLFPKLRKLNQSTLIAAAGTSCRHQISDGVGKKALHPISILRSALK